MKRLILFIFFLFLINTTFSGTKYIILEKVFWLHPQMIRYDVNVGRFLKDNLTIDEFYKKADKFFNKVNKLDYLKKVRLIEKFVKENYVSLDETIKRKSKILNDIISLVKLFEQKSGEKIIIFGSNSVGNNSGGKLIYSVSFSLNDIVDSIMEEKNLSKEDYATFKALLDRYINFITDRERITIPEKWEDMTEVFLYYLWKKEKGEDFSKKFMKIYDYMINPNE